MGLSRCILYDSLLDEQGNARIVTMTKHQGHWYIQDPTRSTPFITDGCIWVEDATNQLLRRWHSVNICRVKAEQIEGIGREKRIEGFMRRMAGELHNVNKGLKSASRSK